jgi:Cdc6-like AAA superfamily ATPase
MIDKSVFEETWLPRRLPGRRAEIQQFLAKLGRARGSDGQPEHVLISGASGVGKTTLARYCLATIRNQTALDLRAHRLQCLGHNYGWILRETAQAAGADVHQGSKTEMLLPALHDAVDEPFVIVLDEGDDLPGTEVLRALTEVEHLGVVAVCHNPQKWLARVDQPIRQRFRGDSHIELERYLVPELAEILEARYREGIDHAGDPPQQRLEQIADRAAGVARVGIQTLRAAAELAWDDGRTTISYDDVEQGIDIARRRVREANLKSLPYHHHVFYTILQVDGGWVSGREIGDRYELIAEQVYSGLTQTSVGRRSQRAKLRKLEDYDLIEFNGENGAKRRYRVIDSDVRSDVVDTTLVATATC